MASQQTIKAIRGATGEVRHFETEAESLRILSWRQQRALEDRAVKEHFCETCGESLEDRPHSFVPTTGKHYCFGCEPSGVGVTTVNMDRVNEADSQFGAGA